MLIMSQNKEDIVILDAVKNVHIDLNDKELGEHPIYVYKDILVMLGKYRDRDRCKEILADIANHYQEVEKYKVTKNNLLQSEFVYYMPEEQIAERE